jgi:hypothetical protein
MSLRERYFGTHADEEQRTEEIREEIRQRWNRQAQWLTCPYMEEFKEKLDIWLEAHEPQPASHEEMLFCSGTRNGLMLVKKHIDDMERHLKGVRDV